MRTFKGQTTIDFKAVVPDTFLADMRAQAQAEDATPFLKTTQANHPVNDDAFIAAVLSNGIRAGIRQDLINRFQSSGIGGSVAPGSITITEHIREHDAPPAKPQLVLVGAQKEEA